MGAVSVQVFVRIFIEVTETALFYSKKKGKVNYEDMSSYSNINASDEVQKVLENLCCIRDNKFIEQ